MSLVIVGASGCKSGGESGQWLLNGFLDPTQQGQFLEPRRNEIRASLSILEEPIEIQDADDPRPDDLSADYSEHVITPGDVLAISIFELLVPGQATAAQVQVGRSGFESLPTLGRVRMAGLTLSGLEMELRSLLREREVLPDPEVQVALAATRASRFSVIGSISRPGTYDIPQPQYRLLQAIADAGGISPVIPRVYVFRNGAALPGGETGPVETKEDKSSSDRSKEFGMRNAEFGMLKTGRGGRDGGRDGAIDAFPPLMMSDVSGGASSAPATEPQLPPASPTTAAATMDSTIIENGAAEPPVPSDSPATAPATSLEQPTPAEPVDRGMEIQPAPKLEPPAGELPSGVVDELEILEGGPTSERHSIIWDAEEGWIIKPLETAETPASGPSATAPASQEGGQAAPWPFSEEPSSAVRIIEVPTKELLAGDPRYNIVIRPFDLINVPPGSVGEYYMMGNVTRPGAYDITGRRLTVKEAVAAAGGFGQLAWPSRADLIRRVSQDEEQIIQLDLDAIFAGNAPDFYLKPNDIVNVGTSPAALFLAVLRNAFRFSYGFGFVYDRNFADSDTFQAREQVRQRRIQEAQLSGVPIQ